MFVLSRQHLFIIVVFTPIAFHVQALLVDHITSFFDQLELAFKGKQLLDARFRSYFES